MRATVRKAGGLGSRLIVAECWMTLEEAQGIAQASRHVVRSEFPVHEMRLLLKEHLKSGHKASKVVR